MKTIRITQLGHIRCDDDEAPFDILCTEGKPYCYNCPLLAINGRYD